MWAGAGPKKGIVNEVSLNDFFLRAAFVLGLFPVGGDFPSPVNKKKNTEMVVSMKSFILDGK